ncbi:MAG: DUF4388 domain-containing protein [Deltaproteobacteria bacterium]|nr:DUF4388 domain-containing protein [Myxococcales bacterium]MDP3216916.1 DUF4388 domain-containing protein [Deltaproteobacteria bacterium]
MSIPPQGHLHEHLLAEGLVTADQLEGALHRVRGDGSRIEDVLIESGVISEADLLKFLAKLYRTRFVATNKLARAEVDRGLLEVIPRRLAEEFQVFPVLFDPASSTLSVVSPDAGDPAVLSTVQQASNARDVRVYVARPAAVRAAILKHYAGELYAFAQVDTTGREQYLSMIDLYAQHSIQGPTAPSSAPATPTTERRERVVSDSDVARAPMRAPSSATSKASFLELATVLVSLLENNRGELRGHSPLVSRWMRKLAERIRLAPEEVHALVLAALLHDVGKAATYHLTALNVAMFDNHRVAAQKTFQTAIKLFEAVPLEPTTVTTLQTMYERFDGAGFPDGLAGKEIPLGARILAVVDTYADLTQNPNNPYRRQLAAPEACDVLDRHKGSVFDRNLVDLLRQVVTGDDLRAKLLSERTVVLLIDPDPEESTVLELRMVEEGFEVHLARNIEEAQGVLGRGAVEAVISETDLESTSGLDLLAALRSSGSTVPWVFLTRDQRREAIARAFELGANDYVLKPASPEVLIAKVKQLLAQRQARSPRGVSGSLAELALTDVVQVLSQGRKTGQLSIRNGAEQGEVHFLDGNVVNALWQGLRGEDAFFAMLGLSTGDFALDPTFRPSSQAINSNVEALMLEGMRRLDEARS